MYLEANVFLTLPHQRRSEETFKQTYSGTVLPYDCDFAPVQRWGAMHDKFFFAPV
jgi:hypothetical protein